MPNKLLFVLTLASFSAFAGESVYFEKQSAEAHGVSERIFEEAGFSLVRKYDGGAGWHVGVSINETRTEGERGALWMALLTANYVCPIGKQEEVLLAGTVYTDSRTHSDPSAYFRKHAINTTVENNATNAVKYLKSGAADKPRQQCAELQKRYRFKP